MKTAPSVLISPKSVNYSQARRAYLECLMALGFTLIKLHFIDAHGECSCHPMSQTRVKNYSDGIEAAKAGITLPCTVPGKHPMTGSVEKAVMTSLFEMEAHLDQGGGIGMVLRVKELPRSPLRVVAYDCDRPGAAEWLKARGIESPWEVYGRGGKHVFGLLPSNGPDFLSSTKTLNPGRKGPTSEEKPGIDIKTSGHLVVAFSPFKRLVLRGMDVSEDPEAIRAFFKDEATVRARLPEFDPRALAPTIGVFQLDSPLQKVGRRRRKQNLVKILSTKKPSKEEITGPYRRLPYNERKTYARRFLVVLAKAPVGEEREKSFYRTLCTLRNRYWLSERDTFEALWNLYNPRCADAAGKPAPFSARKIAYMLLRTSERDTFDPLQESKMGAKIRAEIEASVEKRLEARRKKTQLTNQRRGEERADRQGNILAGMSVFIEEHCHVTEDEEDIIPFNRLRDAYQAWAYQSPYEADVAKKVFGDCLNALGFGRDEERVNGKKILLVTGLRLQ